METHGCTSRSDSQSNESSSGFSIVSHSFYLDNAASTRASQSVAKSFGVSDRAKYHPLYRGEWGNRLRVMKGDSLPDHGWLLERYLEIHVSGNCTTRQA